MQIVPQQNAAATTRQAGSGSRGELGSKDIFLKILVAQMQNQDPLKPQDAAQMSTQLAQFNMVEQQISTNRLLEKMLARSQGTADIAAAAAYLGRQATAQTASFRFDGKSPVQLAIDIRKDAAGAKVQVMDNTGRVVKTLYSGFLHAGINPLTWSGNTDNGPMAQAGDYHLKVAATDSNGHDITARTRITGKVTALQPSADGLSVLIAGTPVPAADIAEIR